MSKDTESIISSPAKESPGPDGFMAEFYKHLNNTNSQNFLKIEESILINSFYKIIIIPTSKLNRHYKGWGEPLSQMKITQENTTTLYSTAQ